VLDLWTMKPLGVFADNWPEAYTQSTIPPHGSLLVKVTPSKGKGKGGGVAGQGKGGQGQGHVPTADFGRMALARECPVWGCEVQRQVHSAWATGDLGARGDSGSTTAAY
jgi:hypothetical protein